MLVVHAGATPLPAIKKAVNAIGQDRILGVVMNHAATSALPQSYGYYYVETDERPGAGEVKPWAFER